MTLESGLWSWLSKARLELGPALHMDRIENMLSAGTPDVEGQLNLTPWIGQFWIELKSHERPVRRSTPIRFPLKRREAQIEFMRKRWEIGGNAFWLLQVGSGHERRLYLAAGDMGDMLKDGLTESELAVEVATYGALPPKLTPVDVLKWIVTCRAKLSLLRR